MRLVPLLIAFVLAGCSPQDGPDARLVTVEGADLARGERLLSQYQCGSCHRIPEIPSAAGRTGPSLEAFGMRAYIAGEVPNGPQMLQRWLQDPQSLVPDTTMPDMGVSPIDARDMAGYLLSLR
jgi:cytochrome c